MSLMQTKPTSWLALCDQYQVVAAEGVRTFFGRFPLATIAAATDDVTIVVDSGNRLDSLAEQQYGDPNLWWALAVRNRLRRPLQDLQVGQQLVVPSISVVRAAIASVEDQR